MVNSVVDFTLETTLKCSDQRATDRTAACFSYLLVLLLFCGKCTAKVTLTVKGEGAGFVSFLSFGETLIFGEEKESQRGKEGNEKRLALVT